jgi:hypothetical protein
MEWIGLDESHAGYGPLVNCCEHSYEHNNVCKYFENLLTSWLLKKGYALRIKTNNKLPGL